MHYFLKLSPLDFAHCLIFRFGKTMERTRAGINLTSVIYVLCSVRIRILDVPQNNQNVLVLIVCSMYSQYMYD